MCEEREEKEKQREKKVRERQKEVFCYENRRFRSSNAMISEFRLPVFYPRSKIIIFDNNIIIANF